MHTFLVFLFLVASSLHLGDDYSFFQWFVGTLLCLIPIHLWVKNKTSKLFATCFTLFSAYVIYVTLSSFSVYATLSQARRVGFSLTASMNYLCVAVPVFAMLTVDRRALLGVVDVLPLMALANSIYVIITAILGIKFTNSMGYSGFMDYSGMNGVLIAICTIPSISVLFINKKDRVHLTVLVTALIAIFLSRGSIAWGVLFCGIAGVILSLQRGAKTLLKLLPLALVPILIAVLSEGKDVLDSGRRLEAYQVFISGWWGEDIWTRLLGYGPSTFQLIAKPIQQKAGFMMSKEGSGWLWSWLHSDPLQTLIEYGIIGFALTIALISETLIKLYRKNDKTIFAIACSIVGASIFDYPARLWPTAVLIMWCMVYAHRSEELT